MPRNACICQHEDDTEKNQKAKLPKGLKFQGETVTRKQLKKMVREVMSSGGQILDQGDKVTISKNNFTQLPDKAKGMLKPDTEYTVISSSNLTDNALIDAGGGKKVLIPGKLCQTAFRENLFGKQSYQHVGTAAGQSTYDALNQAKVRYEKDGHGDIYVHPDDVQKAKKALNKNIEAFSQKGTGRVKITKTGKGPYIWKRDTKKDEVSPPGWSGTTKAMKKHSDITNPFALAWSMKNKGYKSHKKPEKEMKLTEIIQKIRK
jgi:hypothetical protein